MNGVAASRPISWIVTMFGWFSAEAERASVSKRESRSGIAATARPRAP